MQNFGLATTLATPGGGGWGTPHMEGVGMLVGNFELNPKGDRSGRGPSFFWPLKETIGLYEWSK